MSYHYPKSCVQAGAWCSTCGKNTPHRVADRRLQFCIPCFDKKAAVKAAARKLETPAEQIPMFEGKP